jgi:hypothetical protein
LLRRLRQATPEQLEAIERILAGPAVPERLLVPSSRYAAPGARKARGELSGCLLYDPPAETRWAVSQ